MRAADEQAACPIRSPRLPALPTAPGPALLPRSIHRRRRAHTAVSSHARRTNTRSRRLPRPAHLSASHARALLSPARSCDEAAEIYGGNDDASASASARGGEQKAGGQDEKLRALGGRTGGTGVGGEQTDSSSSRFSAFLESLLIAMAAASRSRSLSRRRLHLDHTRVHDTA